MSVAIEDDLSHPFLPSSKPTRTKSKANIARTGAEEVTDLKDVDITTPLQPDEIMPRMEHRATTRNGRSPPVAAQADMLTPGEDRRKKKRSSGKASGSRKSSSLGKSRSSKSKGRSDGGGGGGGGGMEAPLIDLDDFGMKSSSPAMRRESLDTRQLKANAMDLLHFGEASPVRQQYSDMLTPSSGVESSRKEKSGSVDILGLDDSPVKAAMATEERPSKSLMKGKRSSSRSGSSKKPSSATNGLDELVATSSSSTKKKSSSSRRDKEGEGPVSFRSLRFPLIKSSDIKVDYSLSIEPAKQKVTISFKIKNTSQGQ